MSIDKVNVEQKLAQIKAMGGKKDKIDTPQEQFQFALFEQEVLLNPNKYTEKDRKAVSDCKKEVSLFLANKNAAQKCKCHHCIGEYDL